jgi:pyruvate dehydrogenase (quinone)
VALGRRTEVDIPVHGDVLPTLQALLSMVEKQKSDRFLRRMLKKHDRLMNKSVGAYTRKADKLVPIHPTVGSRCCSVS